MQKQLFTLALAALAGCAPYDGFYREGVTLARLNSDQTACEVEAVQTVPPNTQIRRTPIDIIPGQLICNDAGDCTRTAPEIVGGEVYTVDANAPLRARVAAQCMADKGYVRVQIPLCEPGRAEGQVVPATLPPLTGKICAVRQSGQGFVFVSAGG